MHYMHYTEEVNGVRELLLVPNIPANGILIRDFWIAGESGGD